MISFWYTYHLQALLSVSALLYYILAGHSLLGAVLGGYVAFGKPAYSNKAIPVIICMWDIHFILKCLEAQLTACLEWHCPHTCPACGRNLAVHRLRGAARRLVTWIAFHSFHHPVSDYCFLRKTISSLVVFLLLLPLLLLHMRPLVNIVSVNNVYIRVFASSAASCLTGSTQELTMQTLVCWSTPASVA